MPLPSQTEIVNIALGHIKQRKIASMAEVSVQAVEANRCYETARREALRSHDWGFATVVKYLALSATYQDYVAWVTGTAYSIDDLVSYGDGYYRCVVAHTASALFSTDSANWAVSTTLYAGKWLFAYAYPSNCVALWHVYNEVTPDKDNGEQFRIVYDDVNAAKVVLTDCDQALGEYTFDVEDTTQFDASFVTAFAFRLAYDMAPNLTGDDSIAGEMLKLFNVAVSEAERMSSYEAKDDSSKKTTSPYEDYR